MTFRKRIARASSTRGTCLTAFGWHVTASEISVSGMPQRSEARAHAKSHTDRVRATRPEVPDHPSPSPPALRFALLPSGWVQESRK